MFVIINTQSKKKLLYLKRCEEDFEYSHNIEDSIQFETLEETLHFILEVQSKHKINYLTFMEYEFIKERQSILNQELKKFSLMSIMWIIISLIIILVNT